MAAVPAPARAATLRVIVGTLFLLGALSGAPVLVLALIHRCAPNTVDSPLGQTLALLPALFEDNPIAALQVIGAQPLAVIAYLEPGTGLRLWEVYLHLLPLLLLLAAAFYASRLLARGPGGAAQILPCAGGLLSLAFALHTIRVAACCTAPGWGAEIWLRALALSPPLGGVDWAELYPRIVPFLLPAQILFAGGGAALVLMASATATSSR